MSTDYRVIGISLDRSDLLSFVRAHQMNFPVYTGPAGNVIQRYGLGVPPEMIVVSPDGVVLASWNGPYQQETKAAVESLFFITLPVA